MNGTVGTSKVEDVKCLPGKTKRFKLFTVKVYKFSFKADHFTFNKTTQIDILKNIKLLKQLQHIEKNKSTNQV